MAYIFRSLCLMFASTRTLDISQIADAIIEAADPLGVANVMENVPISVWSLEMFKF